MAITPAELQFRLSGGAANSDGNASIGGAISANEIGQNLHDLFDLVSSDEAAAGDVEYRCIYIINTNGSLTAQSVSIFIQSNTPSGDSQIAIGLGAAGLNATESAVADESTAPAGVTFSEPANDGAGLNPVDIPAGQYVSLWIRRTINAAASALNNDTATLRVAVDTAE